MPSKKNIELLEKTKEKLSRAGAVFFLDYQGLTHKQLEEARLLFRENNSEFSVVKNTLVDRLFKEKDLSFDKALKGPLGLLFSYEDAIKTAKALFAFFKKHNLLNLPVGPKIKFGYFENKIISDADVMVLANLPGREILLGKLVGVLANPLTRFVVSLNWNIQKLALVLKAIEKKKSN